MDRLLAHAAGAATRFFGSIRMRLVALVMLAAIPLLLLAGTIAWQNYHLALDVSLQRAVHLREAAIARHTGAINGAEQMLKALASPELAKADTAACHARLASLLDSEATHYANLGLFDSDGHVRCLARPLSATVQITQVEARDRDLFRAAKAANGFTLGAVRGSTFRFGHVIPAAYPITVGGQVAGYLYAGLRVDQLVDGDQTEPMPALWLVDDTGHFTAVARDQPDAMPSPALATRLLDRPTAIDAESEAGVPYTYASVGLPGGYRMVIAHPSGADHAAADAVLLWRCVLLALFLGLGLAAVALGTHRALVSPLNQLSEAVAAWRRTGKFNPDTLQSPPLEVRNLALSFAEATATLSEQERKLAEAIEHQALLIREIHHRVKNNLQIVASLLNLQAARIRAPGAKAEFAAARDRVRALATLHRHLYSQGDLVTLNMRDFLTELCGQLFEAMGERNNTRIQLTIEASDLQMNGDQAVPLALIVTEAVSNAVKYAFPAGRSGHVGVYLHTQGDQARLMIRDDGIGMAPDAVTETETGKRDGLGIQLIRGFAKQLRATLTVEQENGTCYDLLIPLAA
jgi:two-component sensor histidine kinase